jgi:hypothetical protein
MLLQAYFPAFFPTTVYLPLHANARFYDVNKQELHQALAAPEPTAVVSLST